MKNITEILIFLLALSHFVPPFFSEGVHFDNVYFLLLYLFLTACGVLFPYTKKIKPIIAFISTFLGMWAFAMFIYEVYHFNMSDEMIKELASKERFNKILIMFVFGIGFFRTNILWQTQKK